MSLCSNGRPVEFDFQSLDASGSAGTVRVRAAGSRASISMGPKERMIIQKASAVVAAGITAVIFTDTELLGLIDQLEPGEAMIALGPGVNNVDLIGTGGGTCTGIGENINFPLPRVIASGPGAITISGVGVIVGG